MTETEYRAAYLRIWNLADQLFKFYDPCQLSLERCIGLGLDPSGRSSAERCCGGCPHHDCSCGCTVKALSCKLWLCLELESVHFDWNSHGKPFGISDFGRELHRLRVQAFRLGPLYFRSSLDQHVHRLIDLGLLQPIAA